MASTPKDEAGRWPFEALSAGWAWHSFADLFDDVTSSDHKLPQSEYESSGELPVIDQGMAEVGGYTSRADLAHEGPLPVLVFGDHTRCVKFVQVRFVQGADGVKVLRPRDLVLGRYAFHALRALQLPDKGYSRHFKFLRASRFPVPALETQRLIVAKLDALLAQTRVAREQLGAVPPLVEKFRQSALAAAFRGDLTREWRQRNETVDVAQRLAAAKAKNTEPVRRTVPESVPEPTFLSRATAPKGWVLASVAELLRSRALIDVKDGNHGAVHPKTAEFSKQGLPFITAAQVRDLEIDYEGAPKIEGVALERLKVGFAEPGDAILTHKGTVGRTAVNHIKCVLSPQTTYYRCAPDLLEPEFMAHALASPEVYVQMSAVMSQTTRDFVPISEQYKLFVRVPPVEEQRRVVTELTRVFKLCKELEAAANEAFAGLERANSSVLAAAFQR